jgi:hypothetical protein
MIEAAASSVWPMTDGLHFIAKEQPLIIDLYVLYSNTIYSHGGLYAETHDCRYAAKADKSLPESKQLRSRRWMAAMAKALIG